MDKENPIKDDRQYDNLIIARLIRRQERQYTLHLIQHKKTYTAVKSF